MTGTQLLALLNQILGGESINQVYALQLINLARINIEARRPWQVLKAVDKSQTVNGSNNYTVPFNIPANFVRYLGESSLSQGSIILFDGNTDVEIITEIPFESTLMYKQEYGRFSADYGAMKFYLMGLIPKLYTIYQYYIADYGDVTLSTTWLRFPARFAPILAFDAAARYRLGTDYDDVNARNANDNAKMVDTIYDSMSSWDTELAISTVNSLDYRNDQYPNFNNNFSNGNQYRP